MNKPEELSIAKTKLLILQQNFQDYEMQFGRVLMNLDNDPDSAILGLTSIIEDIFNKIWVQNKGETEIPSRLVDILKEESIKNLLPKNTLTRVHNLRILGNTARHQRIDEPAKLDDALIAIHMHFDIMSWYGATYYNIAQLPEPVQAKLSFRSYIKALFSNKSMMFLVVAHVVICFGLIRWHNALPTELNQLFTNTYEGIFTNPGDFGLIFSFSYAVGIIFLTSILAWSIFKEFRRQGLWAMVYSFELMFSVVFSIQFIALAMIDTSTRLF